MFAIFNSAIVGYSWLFLREVRAIIISNWSKSDILVSDHQSLTRRDAEHFWGQSGSDAKFVKASYHENIPDVPLEYK